MKRPDLIALFQPLAKTTKVVATEALDFLVDELNGYLAPYYARVRFDPDRNGYVFFDETLQLNDRKELMERLDRDRDVMWSCDVDMGIAPAEIHTAVYTDVTNETLANLVLDFEPGLTSFVENEAEAQVPFAIFVIRVAQKVGADWLACGPYLGDWKPLTLEMLYDPPQLGWPYVYAWKPETLDEQRLVAARGLKLDDIQRSTLGYRFLTAYP